MWQESALRHSAQRKTSGENAKVGAVVVFTVHDDGVRWLCARRPAEPYERLRERALVSH
jgi:hypothetical protein